MKMFSKLPLRILGLVVVLLATSWSINAQEAARLRLDGLDKLATNSAHKLSFDLNGRLLQLAIRALSSGDANDPKMVKIREAVQGLKGIYARSFEFEADNAYAAADLEDVRTQLRSGTWERLAGIQSKKDGQNIEVFTMFEGDRIGGLTVLATDTRHVSVVNIVGMIDLEKLMTLQGNFGIPNVNITLPIKIKTKP
ncbi:MAG: DUF4252 domain-containing protein [Pyrinomonadaceae bacterium]